MTTSPSDRAHKLALECVRSCREDGLDKSLAEYDRVAALIAAAITQAENDKLEEAAQRLERIDNSGLVIVEMAPSSAAEICRSLKSKD